MSLPPSSTIAARNEELGSDFRHIPSPGRLDLPQRVLPPTLSCTVLLRGEILFVVLLACVALVREVPRYLGRLVVTLRTTYIDSTPTLF